MISERDAAWFVSYAWRDDTSPAGQMREQQVDQACEAARAGGVVISRDKDVLRPGDSIERFMQDIGVGDRIFVFLSDKYLRSPFCMFELCAVWRQSRQDAGVLRDRLRLWTLDDANVWTPEGRASYARFWRECHESLRAHVGDLGGLDLLAWQRMRTFHNEVGDILATLADTVQARDFEEFLHWGFSEVPRGGAEVRGAHTEDDQGQYQLLLDHYFRDLSKGERIAVLVKLGLIQKNFFARPSQTLERRLLESLKDAGRLGELEAAIRAMS